MDGASLVGPLIALVGTVATAGIALWSSVLLRRSERAREAEQGRADAREAEAGRLRAERERLDARTAEMFDEYRDEIQRLRDLLREREGRGG